MTKSGNPLVEIDRSQRHVAVVTMLRPEKRNALNVALLTALTEAIQKLECDSDCRVLILRGDGPVFCSGLDLVEASDPTRAEASALGVRTVLMALHHSRLVTIAAAQGGAYAGGAGLLAACDLCVASQDFQLGLPELRRGLVPALIFAVFAGKTRGGDLRELFLVGSPVSAERAREMGLVQWIVPEEELISHARSIASEILEGGPKAVHITKQLLNSQTVAPDMERLQKLHEEVRRSPEAAEGLAAFRERRRPNW